MTGRTICRAEDIIDGRFYVCVKDPDHTGNHTMRPESHPVIKKLADKSDAPSLPRRQPGKGRRQSLPRHLEPVGWEREPDWFNTDDDTPTVQLPQWTCPVRVKDDGVEHACDRHDLHDPDPMSGGHHWYAVTKATGAAVAAPFDPDLLLGEVDQDFAEHTRALTEIGRSVLLDLAMEELDRECEEFNAAVDRFAGEVRGLTRWIDFAEAAKAAGHHAATAYCIVGDRYDPAGVEA